MLLEVTGGSDAELELIEGEDVKVTLLEELDDDDETGTEEVLELYTPVDDDGDAEEPGVTQSGPAGPVKGWQSVPRSLAALKSLVKRGEPVPLITSILEVSAYAGSRLVKTAV